MDVIINNPPAAQTYAQVQGNPYGYGPMPQGYGYQHHGPGLLLPLLVIGGFVFLKRRRRMMRHDMQAGFMGAGGHRCGPREGQEFKEEFLKGREQMREKFRQGREQFFQDGALGIARERYAKGEINADEYETLRRTLSGEKNSHAPQSGESYRPVSDEGDLKL